MSLGTKCVSYAADFASHPLVRYAFINQFQLIWPVRKLCRLLDVHPSGFYSWLKTPKSSRSITEQRLSGLIKQFWLESGLSKDLQRLTRV